MVKTWTGANYVSAGMIITITKLFSTGKRPEEFLGKVLVKPSGRIRVAYILAYSKQSG